MISKTITDISYPYLLLKVKDLKNNVILVVPFFAISFVINGFTFAKKKETFILLDTPM